VSVIIPCLIGFGGLVLALSGGAAFHFEGLELHRPHRPKAFIAKAAIHQLDRWVRTGVAPTAADRLEISGDPPALVLDAYGNVKGGIRTPYVDVPIAKLSGLGQPAVPLISSLFGTTELFDDATLSRLYPDHRTYVTAVEYSTDAAVRAGFLMPEDGELIKAAAAASGIGNP
jgi:hypothetical protein